MRDNTQGRLSNQLAVTRYVSDATGERVVNSPFHDFDRARVDDDFAAVRADQVLFGPVAEPEVARAGRFRWLGRVFARRSGGWQAAPGARLRPDDFLDSASWRDADFSDLPAEEQAAARLANEMIGVAQVRLRIDTALAEAQARAAATRPRARILPEQVGIAAVMWLAIGNAVWLWLK